uniref:Fibronectin type-III domain-containing protein n=1 Tax=Dicentrarchus labrax TaxID=13489 RepID=A0A8C4ICU4_DICLA
MHTHAKEDLTVPEQVSLSANMSTKQLSISWLGGTATTFDLMILRTEFNETVFYETVSVTVNQVSGRHQWNWTSVEPLECTSLSIKIRSRDGQTTSEWSSTQILQGSDLPSNDKFQMYPQDKVVPVGANTTFCCIVEEGKVFGNIQQSNTVMNTMQLSRRSYATTVYNQEPSVRTGTNILCYDYPKTQLTGAVVFVGYPPLPSDLMCETHDLISAVCQWNEGRDTHLYGKRRTLYSLNKRICPQTQRERKCIMDQWDGNWTLVAQNPLGQYSLTYSAELSHRVRPEAPANVNSIVHAWYATVLWQWKYSTYSSLALVCEVELSSQGYKTTHTFSGVGLRSVDLPDLYPDEDYSVQVRCSAQQNFWKWGDWSKPFFFKTKTYVPEAPDVWMWMNRDNTGQVIWKLGKDIPSGSVSLSASQQDSNILLTWGEIPLVKRRGFIQGYNVYISNGSQLALLANLSYQGARNYTVKGFSEGSYKFTVKAYTSAGEDTGATASIMLELYTDWLILEILASLGITALFLIIVTFICYKKRKWVKKAFYPDIPEPKLPGDWARTQGPLDVKPSPHSMVHIVEKPEWDSSKEMLVVIPEEDEDEEGQGIGDEPVDTDEPTSLRYYNHVVDERPIRPRYPDSSTSSASSLDSARTDVTYTGIQTSGPQMQTRPFLDPQVASGGGYKPQSSWNFDVDAGESCGLAPSLGSPTSVASTQFLLPDEEEHGEEKRQLSSSAATWFTNLLSSTKP